MQTGVNGYKTDFVFRIFGLVIVCYLLARTYYVNITDDEAWSYYNVKNFWWVETLCSGNTHWFNFVAIKAALLLGFEKVWQIRWFSVLSGVVFLSVTYLWIKQLPGFSLKVFAFTFVFLNPYLVEYLTLARGYSSGLCFFALSFLFFFKALNYPDKRIWHMMALICAGAAAVANFNFFYSFVPFCCIYFYEFYFKAFGIQLISKGRFYIDILIALAVSFLVLGALAFIKDCSNDIGSFGGDELVPALFYSFVDRLFYRRLMQGDVVLVILAWALFVLVIASLLYGILKYKSHQNKIYFYASLVLSGMLLLTIINKWCFHVLYPTDRTALMFYPLFALVIVGLIQNLSINNLFKKAGLYVVSVLLLLNFIKSFSLNWGYDHDYCHNVEPGFDYLKLVNPKKVGITSDLYFVFLKYYQHAGYSYQGEPINAIGRPSRFIPDNKLEDFDYLLLRPPYNLSYYKSANVRLEGVKFFEPSKLLIVKVHNLKTSSSNL